MPTSGSLSLPLDWTANETAGGGADLRVRSHRRLYVVAGAAILVIAMGWRVFVQWGVLSQGEVAVRFALILLLTLFALWCAFADEVWHLEKNLLIHRVGMGGWGYSRRVQDAELEIVLRFSRNFSVPYRRLYAVANGKSRFLMEREGQQLAQLARFISFYTGWHIRNAG